MKGCYHKLKLVSKKHNSLLVVLGGTKKIRKIKDSSVTPKYQMNVSRDTNLNINFKWETKLKKRGR